MRFIQFATIKMHFFGKFERKLGACQIFDNFGLIFHGQIVKIFRYESFNMGYLKYLILKVVGGVYIFVKKIF